jgi:hypothetical protein
MITDAQLYTLALFLGAASMLLIVLYHWLEVNAQDDSTLSGSRKADAVPSSVAASGRKVRKE